MIKLFKRAIGWLRVALAVRKEMKRIRAPKTLQSVLEFDARENIDGPMSHRAPPVSIHDPAGGA